MGDTQNVWQRQRYDITINTHSHRTLFARSTVRIQSGKEFTLINAI